MTKLSIAKRIPVQNIRSVWPKEPDFSDWLTTQDGIDLIAQDLEVEIENPRREAKGSNFPCDVVANLVGDEKHVIVIENQYGRTDHDHLGKLINHVAVHKAMTGIWIVEEVADDHRQAIDWLNENTPDTVALYLAELKAHTHGGNQAAPMLDLVCRPNRTMKQTNAGLSEGDRKRREWRIAFWQEIQQRMKAEKLPFRLQKPGPDHWSSIAIGRSGFHIDMCLTPKKQSVALEMIIQPKGWKDAAFGQLQLQSKKIEAEVGKPLQWRPMLENSSSKVVLEEKLDPDVETNREKICEWFSEWTPKIYVAFQDRVKKLAAPKEPQSAV